MSVYSGVVTYAAVIDCPSNPSVHSSDVTYAAVIALFTKPVSTQQ